MLVYDDENFEVEFFVDSPLDNAGMLLCPEEYQYKNFYDLVRDVI